MKNCVRWKRVVGALALLFIMTGCANRQLATVEPTANLKAIRTMHVVKLANDDRDVYQDIADKLRTRGYLVTTGETRKAGVDATVTYFDKWMWDITMYLLQLNVVIRDPNTDQPLASGESMHTSLTRKSQKDMVDEVIENILNKAAGT